MNPNEVPRLAAPGAGIPAPERILAGVYFRWRALVGSRDSFRRDFVSERGRIRALLERCPPEAGGVRVLVPRLRGMEDSSRYWSVWMTLDHLRIVNTSIAGIIAALSSGQVPPGKASTADVKPDPVADASVRAAYETSCDALLAAADDSPQLRGQPCFEHPWFGPMNAFRWFGLAGGHMGIHRAQLSQILLRVPRPDSENR